MKKTVYFIYSIICYVLFLATFLYLIAFVSNLPKMIPGLREFFTTSLDVGTTNLPLTVAVVVNLALVALFGLQHSIMARPAFKEKWTHIVPLPVERSTYVLMASLALIVLFWAWQPITISVWNVSGSALGVVFFGISLLGWAIVLVSTFLINHFDLFGLRQVYLYGKGVKPEKLTFRKPLFYQFIRHPIYLGFLLAFWFAPVMTVGHLIFSLGMTGYILIGIYHEEKDLTQIYGNVYKTYKQETGMLLPFKPNRHNDPPRTTAKTS